MASERGDGSHGRTILTKLANYRPLRLQRYAAVNVLLISWRNDDTESTAEIEQLGRLFKESFNYTTCSYLIPSSGSQRSLNSQLANYLDVFGGPDNLVVVYYGGHGGKGVRTSKSPFSWAANNEVEGPSLDWSMIQPNLFNADCDVAIILDCCYAGQAAKPISAQTIELLAATDKDQWTTNSKSTWPTFTKVLIQEMGKMLEKDRVVTLRGLAKTMSTTEAGLFRQPFYVSLSGDHSAGPIKLAKLLDLGEQYGRLENVAPAVSLQFKLSLFEPLDSGTAASLIRWMTRDSPSSIENIQIADQALTEAKENSQLCNQLLENQSPVEGKLLYYLSKQGQEEGLALLQHLRSAMSSPTSAHLSDGEAMNIIQTVKERSHELVTFIEDSLARLNSTSLHALEASESFKTMHQDLKTRIAMRLTLIGEDMPEEQTRIAFDNRDSARVGQRFRRGLKTGIPVLVEYFYYENIDGKLETDTSRQVRRISALHGEAKSSEFHSMHGVGYLRESLHGHRYGLIYQVPQEKSECSFSLLSDLISKVKTVPLEIRMRTAYTLCEALLCLHSIGWYHKGIRSDNILVFGLESAMDDEGFYTAWDIQCPYLVGFDCSRPSGAETYGTIDFITKNNIYRHPERWGRTAKFESYHDIYALGILLLEVGCWRILPKMDNKQDSFEYIKNPEDLRKFLLGSILDKTAHAAGTEFASAIRFCLEQRRWNDLEEWQIQKMVRQKVLKPLRACFV